LDIFQDTLPAGSLFSGLDFPPDAGSAVVLAFALVLSLDHLVEAILTQSSELSILDIELDLDMEFMRKYDIYDCPKSIQGTPLYIAAALGNGFFVEILIKHGANVNSVTSHGISVLCSALTLSEMASYADDGDLSQVVSLLIDEGADLNPHGVAETPLQRAVRRFSGSDFIEKMLKAGANLNSIGDDKAVMAKLRAEHQGLDDIDDILNKRGLEHYHDTPLKIVMKMIESDASDMLKLFRTKSLLERYGGKALHLFPIKGLPGYVEGDIRAFCWDGLGEAL
jgi:hypothetical protein